LSLIEAVKALVGATGDGSSMMTRAVCSAPGFVCSGTSRGTHCRWSHKVLLSMMEGSNRWIPVLSDVWVKNTVLGSIQEGWWG
jgi:hypothetical protein